MLVHPKEKAEPRERVYKIKCQWCEDCYVGETKKNLAGRVKEHMIDVNNTVKDNVFLHGEKGNNQRLRETNLLPCIMFAKQII